MKNLLFGFICLVTAGCAESASTKPSLGVATGNITEAMNLYDAGETLKAVEAVDDLSASEASKASLKLEFLLGDKALPREVRRGLLEKARAQLGAPEGSSQNLELEYLLALYDSEFQEGGARRWLAKVCERRSSESQCHAAHLQEMLENAQLTGHRVDARILASLAQLLNHVFGPESKSSAAMAFGLYVDDPAASRRILELNNGTTGYSGTRDAFCKAVTMWPSNEADKRLCRSKANGV